jgi:hypothetical protein
MVKKVRSYQLNVIGKKQEQVVLEGGFQWDGE